jgi:ATP-dependent helicase/nuclease subunit B
VLPQLDLEMDGETWAELEPSHPQAGLARLLTGLDARRGDVRPWPAAATVIAPSARFSLLSKALLPASALQQWLDPAKFDPDGLKRLTPADQQQEAEAIALVLRGALETPGATAALVTPDRPLAGRVAAALLRYGIVADDSAGEPLADTPPAVFLRLLIRAVAEDLAPVPLLALLKHPLAAAGMTQSACRAAARALEMACLRGPRPAPGLGNLRRAVDRLSPPQPALANFLTSLEACLEPVLRMDSALAYDARPALADLIEAAERLASTPDAPGTQRIWAGGG